MSHYSFYYEKLQNPILKEFATLKNTRRNTL